MPKTRPPPPGLNEYRAKRNFDRTPEPGADGNRPSRGRADTRTNARGGGRFVVQKHRARNLHYDFRLELDGVLKSWAIPKGPSLDPAAKPLAIQVEDHPLEYAAFEGVIPEGEYGAGPVIIWDRGEWEPLNDPHEGLDRGDLKFRLHGQRLRGEWAIVRMKGGGRRGDTADGRHWLLIKKRDAAATTDDVLAIDTSVVSGQTLDDLGAAAPRAGRQRRARVIGAAGQADAPPTAETSSRPEIPDPSRLPGAVKAAHPATLRPQLASPAAQPPAGDRWLHEIKYDGYRLLCVVTDGRVRLLTRSGQDWTATFRTVADAATGLGLRDGIVDGEVVVLDPRGIPDFQALQNALKGRSRSPLVYYAFDLPYAWGWDLRRCSLENRKDALARLLEGRGGTAKSTIRFSDHIRGHGAEVFRQAYAAGLEGIVSKRADAPYESRRTDTWRKVKCRRTDEFVIAGFTEPEGSREGLGALVLARPEPGEKKLVYRGKVGTGFDTAVLHDLRERLSALERPGPAIRPPQDPAERAGVHWVEPLLVADVEYGSVTRDGHIRHATYRGLRLDKPAADVTDAPLEPRAAVPSSHRAAPSGASPADPPNRPVVVRTSRRPGAAIVGGVQITNPERIVYPDVGVTKLQVAEYYLAAAERILPFLVDRPLSLLRCPKGIGERGFFQRHPLESFPESVAVVTIRDHDERFITIRGVEGLLALVQFGTIEFHPWACATGSPDHPDFVTFDLDPGEGVSWPGVVTAAAAMRDYLRSLAMESWVKTSGGKGLHVVAPLSGRETWEDAKVFSARVAETIARAVPQRFTSAATTDRRGRIYIDHLRNRQGSTSVAPYSLRARPGAPVSTPLTWHELARCPGPAAFAIGSMAARLKAPDPWHGFAHGGGRLPRTEKQR